MEVYQQQRIDLLLKRWESERRIGYPRVKPGPFNRISDVAGVKVGHVTLADGAIQTGVSAIQPASHALFDEPLPCAAAVFNGFAKPVGLIQIEELGLLQTPVLLGNTFAVGRMFSALVRHSCRENPAIGREKPTVNPLVLECNDGFLNDLQAMAVTEDLAESALAQVDTTFERGSVGAGRGMSCFGLKGGIGTSSRIIPQLDATLGVLVLANFGVLSQLTLDGVVIGDMMAPLLPNLAPQKDAGSIIMVMATDAPLSARQLKRVAKRAGAGLGRLGSYWGHGSGDIAVAFSTKKQSVEWIDDAMLEPMLCAAADAVEFAVLDALLEATPVQGFCGHYRPALSDVLDGLVKQR
ncbi:MAG: Beta-peptidyl aminopeptidase BapA [Candidatus Celerinatantimonas neptuna]|nr:MAG: Beta-peptidyl aminopeptidase BapA [Candidatus Celerinatantimonas neptuna]